MRRIIGKIRDVLHVGEDIDFLNTLLEYAQLRPRDLIFGGIGSGAMGVWRAWEGAAPAELALYIIAAFVIILAGIAIG